MLRQLRIALRRIRFLHPFLVGLRRGYQRLMIGILEIVRRLPGPLSFGLAPGFYSDLALLQSDPPQIEGRIVLLDQGNFEASPDSLLVKSQRAQHQSQPWPIFWTHHRDAELVGSSLAHVNAQGRLCQEATYQQWSREDPAYNYARHLTKPVRLEGNWTSLISRWMPSTSVRPYAHWLQDVLPRLALLPEFPPDTRILVPGVGLPYQVASLEMLGMLDRCRWTSEQHVQIQCYYFSAPTSMIACYNPFATDWIRKALIPLVESDPRPSPKRFFVRRVGNVRNVVNEDEVIDFFKSLRWEIVDAGALSFPDQVRYFSRAEAICAIHGSGFTNTVFCPPGAGLLELFADTYLASDAEWIARCISANHRHLIFPSDYRLNAIIDLKRVRQTLAEMDLL